MSQKPTGIYATTPVLCENLHLCALRNKPTMEFNIIINAPKGTVWHALWDDASYRAWTAAFAAGSWAKTDWHKGSKVLFLDAKGSGMFSVIEDKTPNEYMLFRHLGVVMNGVEAPASPESEEWAGATEDYTLTEVNGLTELRVTLNAARISNGMLDYFMQAWPKALDKLKELAEAGK